MVVSLVNLGRLDYAAALALQQQVCALRQQERIGDVLLLVEHPPVLTLGRNAHRGHVVASDELLARRGISLFETNRGGDVTYHGPGSWWVIPFSICAASPRRWASSSTCASWKRCSFAPARTTACLPSARPGAPASGPCPEVRSRRRRLPPWACTCARGVTTHGFALNVTTDLDDFELIVPCGIRDRGVTSIEAEVDPAPSLGQMANSVARHFGRVFGRQVVWVGSAGRSAALRVRAHDALGLL